MRNVKKSRSSASRSPAAPKPPVIAGEPLAGDEISFLEFLHDDTCKRFCHMLFGGRDTSTGTTLWEFREATQFHYFGHRRSRPGSRQPRNPGKLDATKTTSKRTLKTFARLAYRGDPDRRGIVYWERIATLIWDAYTNLMAMRRRAEKIKQQEIDRIASIPAKRTGRAAYMRRYRTKLRAKASRHFKDGAKRQWRKQRRGSTSGR